MYLLFRLLSLGLIFWFLLPSFERIYSYHFGIVTNSDALYPYLFIKDFSQSFEFVRAWITPPSHCFFPDLILIFFLTKISSDIFVVHALFAFFCFLSVVYLMKKLGFSRGIGLVTALSFLKLGEYYPASWGQFFLPSFHGTEFFLLGLCISFVHKMNSRSFFPFLSFSFVLGLSVYSELWFLVHSLIPILFYFIFSSKRQIRDIILTILIAYLFYSLFIFLQKKTGIGSYQPKNFPISESLNRAYFDFVNNSKQTFELLFLKQNSVPLSEYFLPTFWILLFVTLVSSTTAPLLGRQLILPLGTILALIFLQIVKTETNPRYFYFLPASCIALFFFLIKDKPFLRKLVIFMSLLGLIFTSHRFWVEETTAKQILLGKKYHEARLSCVTRNWKNWGETPGASGYWPVKYMRAFSNGKIHLIPFTPEGIYYPWVHNLNWDKSTEFPRPTDLKWGIVPNDRSSLFGQEAVETSVCHDWKMIRISN